MSLRSRITTATKYEGLLCTVPKSLELLTPYSLQHSFSRVVRIDSCRNGLKFLITNSSTERRSVPIDRKHRTFTNSSVLLSR